jgi:hypothetical protein
LLEDDCVVAVVREPPDQDTYFLATPISFGIALVPAFESTYNVGRVFGNSFAVVSSGVEPRFGSNEFARESVS